LVEKEQNMRWYKRQKTFVKLMIGFGLMVCMVGLVGQIGALGLDTVDNLSDQLYQDHALPLAHLRAANTRLLQRARMVRNVVLDTVFHDPQAVRNWIAKRERFGDQFSTEYAAFHEAVHRSGNRNESAVMDELVQELDQREREIISLAQAGDPQAANAKLGGVRLISGKIEQRTA
jgi:hypothetical protein